MDACLYYLNAANDSINSMVEISIAESVFSDVYDTEEINVFNEGAIDSAVNALKNAMRVLIEAIKKIVTSITDFFKTRGLSEAEKAKFNEIRRRVASDPQFANQKVTIENYKEYEKIYDDALKKANSLMSKIGAIAGDIAAPMMDAAKSAANQLLDKVKEDVSILGREGAGMAKRASITVTMKTALEIADSNASAAKALKKALNDESAILEAIEKELGHKEAAKFSKKLAAYSRNGIIHRAKVKILGLKKKSLQDVARNQMKAILSFTNIGENGRITGDKGIVSKGSIIRGASMNPDIALNTVKGMKVKDVVGVMKDVSDLKKNAEKAKKKASKTVDDARAFMGIKKKKKK